MSVQVPADNTELVVDTFYADIPYPFDEVETIVIATLQEETCILQGCFSQLAFGKPIEPVLAALLPNLGRYVAERSYGARYQRSLYVKWAFDQATTIGANAAAHVFLRVNMQILSCPFGIGQDWPVWERSTTTRTGTGQ